MAGSNPYLDDPDAPLPTRAYDLVFVTESGREQRIRVDPERLPYGRTGLPGSILDIALAHDLDLDHACGGVCACATCHVHVVEGGESCNETGDGEEDQLDHAPDLSMHSRLACQCVPDGSATVRVQMPTWNRNLAKEGHH